MEEALSPVFIISRVLATFGHTFKRPILQTINNIYCFAVWCFLNYANILVVQEMYEKLETKAQHESKSENIIISYGALIFFLSVFVFNWIVFYLALFGGNKIDGLVAELKIIAVDLNCEDRVAKNTKVFLLKYLAVCVTGILMCVHQDLLTTKKDLHYNNRFMVIYSSMARMIWQEIQLTTFAHITGQLFGEINSRIKVKCVKYLHNITNLISRFCKAQPEV
jgi:hypothetical protein